MSSPLAGVLLLDKPLGLSSNAALQQVRQLCDRPKAGHTGSLDPLATGMLPICLGEATKLAGELLAGRKAYRFTLTLGERTDTGDAEGAVVERAAVPALSTAQIEQTLQRHLGSGSQTPPMYSALKHQGEPLYRLARRGISIERAPRAVRIDELQLVQRAATQLQLRVLCSKGTYVRVLAEDLARALGTCGHLLALRREFVEPFAGLPMWSLEQLRAQRAAGEALPLLPPERAVTHLPSVQLNAAESTALGHGRVLPQRVAAGAGLWRLYDAAERFLGLGESDARGDLRVRRLFNLAS